MTVHFAHSKAYIEDGQIFIVACTLQTLRDPLGHEGGAQQAGEKPTGSPEGVLRASEETAALAGREKVVEPIHTPRGDPTHTGQSAILFLRHLLPRSFLSIFRKVFS